MATKRTVKTANTKPKVKPVTKARPTAAKAKVAATPKQPQVNPHIAAGIKIARYEGPSSFVNGNRKVKIMTDREVSPSKLTSRAQAGLYALRDSYKGSTFEPKGFDNGILRDLVGAGLITLTGGQQQTIDGHAYMVDGSTPVRAKFTAAGANYGKA